MKRFGLGILGLLVVLASAGSASPTPVHGPTGVSAVVEGFSLSYRDDQRYRVAHHGADTMPPGGAGAVARPFAVPAVGEGRIVLESDGLTITAFAVDHSPVHPAVGYRFDFRGRADSDVIELDELL
jgi:ribonuclease Z